MIHSEQNCSYTLSVVPRFSNPLNLGRVSFHFWTKFFASKWDCRCQATSGAKEEKIKIHNFLPQLLLLHVEVPWVSKVWLECLSFAWNHTKSVVELSSLLKYYIFLAATATKLVKCKPHWARLMLVGVELQNCSLVSA